MNSLPRCVGCLVLACALVAPTGEAGAQSALVVTATGSDKLAPELFSVQQGGGILLGRTEAGGAVLQFSATDDGRAGGGGASVTARTIQSRLAGTKGVTAISEKVPTAVQPIRELIVWKKAGTRPGSLESTMGRVRHLKISDREISVLSLRAGAAGFSSAAVDGIARDADVLYVEPNYQYNLIGPLLAARSTDPAGGLAGTAPFDPLFNRQWGMMKINAPLAWTNVTTTSRIVAVVDSGVDYTHEDLALNLWVNAREQPPGMGDGVDNDGNGYIDDYYGYNFAENSGDPMDALGHGTKGAGIIAGRGDNGKGIAGVVWGEKNASTVRSPIIMALKVTATGELSPTTDEIKLATAIQYAVDNGAGVINCSFQGPFGRTLETAVQYADAHGVLVVCAAGNSNNDLDGGLPTYPASFKENNIIAVLAVDEDDRRSWFSNYGALSADIGAPGQRILSTTPHNGYGEDKGTSFAAPQVSGAAALAWADPRYRSYTHLQIKSLLLDNARHVDVLSTPTLQCVTGGVLDLTFLQPRTVLRGETPSDFITIQARGTLKRTAAPRDGGPAGGMIATGQQRNLGAFSVKEIGWLVDYGGQPAVAEAAAGLYDRRIEVRGRVYSMGPRTDEEDRPQRVIAADSLRSSDGDGGDFVRVKIGGRLHHGIFAPANETTGTVVVVREGSPNAVQWELDFANRPGVAPADYDGQKVIIEGNLYAKRGVEVPERRIVEVVGVTRAAQHGGQ